MKLFRLLFPAALPALPATDNRIHIQGTLLSTDPRAADIEVFDKRSGARISMVRAVNVEEGWVERYKQRKDGRLLFRRSGKPLAIRKAEDGSMTPRYRDGWDEPVIERVTGEFELRPRNVFA